MKKPGKIYIVGAGPGDPDLLTIKAYKAILNANVILYDALISEEIKSLFPKNAELIFVGKRAGDGLDITERQAKIHRIMKKKVLQGNIVTRVKSGDPMVFSRGAEESQFLGKNNLPFEIIPGISAFNAVSAEFGIPLTDRHGSNSLHIFSGRDVSGNLLNIQQLYDAIKNNGTAVIYMGVRVLEEISEKLSGLQNGFIYASIVSKSGHKDASIVEGDLSDVVKYVQRNPVKMPALIIMRMHSENGTPRENYSTYIDKREYAMIETEIR